MKFLKVKTKICRNLSDRTINYEDLGISPPEDEIESKIDFINISIKALEETLLLIIPDDDEKCMIEFKDGTKLDIYISMEELVEILNDTK